MRRLLAFALALTLISILLSLPLTSFPRPAEGLPLEMKGQRALAILAGALVLWIMEALPFHLTGILAVLGLALIGAGDYRTIIRDGFGDDVVLFFIGVLTLAAALVRSGLGKRVSLLVLSITGNSTRRIVFGFLAAGAFLSMWVTALASSAILMPLALAILAEECAIPGKSNFGRALMMSVAWGALIGAVGTPAGSGSNPLVVKFMGSMAHVDITFLTWMMLGIPILLLLLPAAWLILIWCFPPETQQLRKTGQAIAAESARQTSMSRDEKATLAVFFLTVAVWISSPLLERLMHVKIPLSMGSLIGAIMLFMPGVTSFKWKEIEKDIDWSGIILIASGIALGMTLYQTGAAGWLSALILGGMGRLPLFLRLVAIVVGVLAVKIAFSSNTLTGTIIVPLVLTLSGALGEEAA
ncbi:MAG: DASS family sodium-coupled anion symporter, partial [Rectinema sp.]|nr:DASS family sodium-coupled anion symporter [Rectinema sp.]